MANRKAKDLAGPSSPPQAADEALPQRDLTAEDVIRRVCKTRGVTAERVLGAILDAMAEDYLHLHAQDERPLEMPGAVLQRVPAALTGLAFRRLMQRLCVDSLAVAKRENDETASNDEWFDAMMAGNRGNAQAAAVDAFDAVAMLAARHVEQAKWEAEVTGQPDPCPHIRFAEGDGVPGSPERAMMIAPRDESPPDAPAATAGNGSPSPDGTMWN
jgi:hypothetical protein